MLFYNVDTDSMSKGSPEEARRLWSALATHEKAATVGIGSSRAGITVSVSEGESREVFQFPRARGKVADVITARVREIGESRGWLADGWRIDHPVRVSALGAGAYRLCVWRPKAS